MHSVWDGGRRLDMQEPHGSQKQKPSRHRPVSPPRGHRSATNLPAEASSRVGDSSSPIPSSVRFARHIGIGPGEHSACACVHICVCVCVRFMRTGNTSGVFVFPSCLLFYFAFPVDCTRHTRTHTHAFCLKVFCVFLAPAASAQKTGGAVCIVVGNARAVCNAFFNAHARLGNLGSCSASECVCVCGRDGK